MIYFFMKVSRSQKCLEIESIFCFRAEIFSAESVSELKVSYDFKAKIDAGLKVSLPGIQNYIFVPWTEIIKINPLKFCFMDSLRHTAILN
jgi:hypothetical protein